MVAHLKTLPLGSPGDITRPTVTTAETGFLTLTTADQPVEYGVAVVSEADGKFRKFKADGDILYGILARTAPSIAGDTSAPLYGGKPNALTPQTIVRSGYVAVKCVVGTPVRGGKVYIAIKVAGGAQIGDLRATEGTKGDSDAIAGYTWASNGKDANNLAELSVLFSGF